jgi:hypothetical protein
LDQGIRLVERPQEADYYRTCAKSSDGVVGWAIDAEKNVNCLQET